MNSSKRKSLESIDNRLQHVQYYHQDFTDFSSLVQGYFQRISDAIVA